jgi:anti-anti-sigma regulatory factor
MVPFGLSAPNTALHLYDFRMKSDDRYTVSADVTKNQLSVHFSGDVDLACMRACVDQIVIQMPNLTKGFKILTDLSNLNSMDSLCVSELKRMMDVCRKSGAGTVARVIPDPAKDIGFNILSLFHYRDKVHVLTFQTLAEAKQALA